ncbi:hypothetical protein BCR43DRAFT_106710 [Syncephalastrum racemosum]|uniref:Ubiquitin carboxyl-terminal hydrolase 7 ICP0-binding domain-containing protein n=1 Tax=Syncephalastrum racemosum TaxID=13706 RepID=A0A1X2H1S6_SYNRA|nr:hypothetical protein BCR43DRAFT_106710 [Syncephalastrum racemosum]
MTYKEFTRDLGLLVSEPIENLWLWAMMDKNEDGKRKKKEMRACSLLTMEETDDSVMEHVYRQNEGNDDELFIYLQKRDTNTQLENDDMLIFIKHYIKQSITGNFFINYGSALVKKDQTIRASLRLLTGKEVQDSQNIPVYKETYHSGKLLDLSRTYYEQNISSGDILYVDFLSQEM